MSKLYPLMLKKYTYDPVSEVIRITLRGLYPSDTSIAYEKINTLAPTQTCSQMII